MKKVLPVLSAAALMLSYPTTLHAADPSQVKKIIDYVREKGVPDVSDVDSAIRLTTVTSQQIGYEGNRSITFTSGIGYFSIVIKELSGGEEVTLMDWNLSSEANQANDITKLGTLDIFVREEITNKNRRFITSASGQDAETLGGRMYDTLISLYLKYIGK